MDFHLDDDQLALQESVAAFCRARWPLDGLAERATDGLDRGAWAELARLGVLSLMVPEAEDGLGLGVVEAVVALEPLGRHLAPGPLLWSMLAAPLVREVATGTALVAGAEDDGAPPFFVEYGAEADFLIVLRADGVDRVDPMHASRVEIAEPLDPLAPTLALATLPPGTRIGDAARAARLRELGTVFAAALQLGVAQAALDVAVAYSLEREQFGVPIGSFQALKHMMADMYVRTGLARSATWAAAGVLDDPEVGHVERGIRAAKLLAGEAAYENARAAIQIFGGMGFTWEMAPNFLLKRALVLDQQFGTPAAHAHAIGTSLAEELR